MTKEEVDSLADAIAWELGTSFMDVAYPMILIELERLLKNVGVKLDDNKVNDKEEK